MSVELKPCLYHEEEYPVPQCAHCKWHREDMGISTSDSPAEYDSWCDAGMPEFALEYYECDLDADECPLRIALEEIDEWIEKAERTATESIPIPRDKNGKPYTEPCDVVRDGEKVRHTGLIYGLDTHSWWVQVSDHDIYCVPAGECEIAEKEQER